MLCRFCRSKIKDLFIDLINSPAANSFLSEHQLNQPETFLPLKVYTCNNCFLVQIDEYKTTDSIFSDEYVYFSSFSKSWLAHASHYCEQMINRFQIGESSQVIEIASNDGYLLQYFIQHNVPVLGIEPSANTAKVAQGKGIECLTEFFGSSLARTLVSKGKKADLLIGNNVLAHVPDLNDFVSGMKILLNPGGIITMEFPHLMQLVDNVQFDTIYHEHFSYFSLYTVQKIFSFHGLELFDVEEIPTHGGSLRIYAKHIGDESRPISDNVRSLLNTEFNKGMNKLSYYQNFKSDVLKVKLQFIEFITKQKLAHKRIAGYGAAAKGNTLLNYCGIKNDQIEFVVDANPHKQNKWLPGSHIPVASEHLLKEAKPEYIIIFPWNLKEEIVSQLQYIQEWNGKFVLPLPQLTIIQ